MEIVEYYASDDQEHWLSEIKRSDWGAGQFLYELLRDNRLKELCGENTKVLLLTDDDALVSFCTYAEQDDIRETSLTPWVGFVYTFPEYRGKRHMGKLLKRAYALAKDDRYDHIYISTGEMGLYEKYGYSFWKMMKDMHGEDSRVYRINVAAGNHARRLVRAQTDDLEIVREITRTTIKSIYPRYYPAGAVQFFLAHHSDEHIMADISDGKVFLLFVGEEPIGTVTISDNNINRLFVLPAFQHKGYGKMLLDFAEKKILESYDCVQIDASFPAKRIYLKRGYKEVEYNIIDTEYGDCLGYDVMRLEKTDGQRG